jgi:hypothetical protein
MLVPTHPSCYTNTIVFLTYATALLTYISSNDSQTQKKLATGLDDQSLPPLIATAHRLSLPRINGRVYSKPANRNRGQLHMLSCDKCRKDKQKVRTGHADCSRC